MSKLYLLMLSLLFTVFTSAQKTGAKKAPAKISAAQKATEEKVKKIKKVFFDINASKLQSKAFTYANKCGVKKGTLTLYYKGSDVVKVTDMGTGDGHLAATNWSYQYYYEKGKLIFAYEQIKEDANARAIETRRYYLGNKLVRKIEDNKTTDNSKETIANTAPEYQLRSVKSEADISKVYKCG